MKRFYKTTRVEAVEGGFRVLLDDRALPTPAKNTFVMPTKALADAVCGEWDRQGEKINPETMPFMTLAATTVDRVAPQPAHVRRTVAAYGEADLLAYQAGRPDTLVRRQAATWGPHIAWAKTRFAPGLTLTTGIMPVTQPPETLAAMTKTVEALGPWALAGVADLAQLTGSLVLPLQLAEAATGITAVINCCLLDERFQEERWGKDEEAAQRRTKKELDLKTAARFLELV